MRVLFVDDEPNVLSGLRRMLYCLSDEWDLAFAAGADEALQYLEDHSCDVVVTDMRMPKMDGAQLLEIIREKYPSIVRIILSGQSAQERVLRCVGPAHQFLSKPCDADHLKSTIRRSCAIRDRLSDSQLTALVTRIDSLPSMSATCTQLLRELDSPSASVAHIGKIISHDVGMTAKVLQLTNSSFFGLPVRITDPARAVTQLGLDRIRSLVLTASMFGQFDRAKVPERVLENIMQHCAAVAGAAQTIAKLETSDKQLVQDAFTAGLLHDVGMLVLMACVPDKYREVIRASREREVSIWEAERSGLGRTHAEAGAYLLSLWGLPDPIVEAVAWHHAPGDCVELIVSPLTFVHVANALQQENCSLNPPNAVSVVDDAYLERLGLQERLPAWRQALAADRPVEVAT
jgi:HD-like signal output (HDOD) protein